MLKLKLQNFGHLMQRVDLLEKTGLTGKDCWERLRAEGGDRMRRLDGISGCEFVRTGRQ